MRILIIGDVVGSAGRAVLNANLPMLREKLKTDFVIVNGENAAHGFGITGNICDSFYQAGANCITTGNHVFDQRDVIGQMERDEKILRPINYPPDTPGKGFGMYKTESGKRILVANVMCRLFMELLDDPFRALDELLKRYKLGRDADAIVFDVHGEATVIRSAVPGLSEWGDIFNEFTACDTVSCTSGSPRADPASYVGRTVEACCP